MPVKSPEVRHIIRMAVEQKEVYEFDLDVSEIGIPPEILGKPDDIYDWIVENDSTWVDYLNNQSFVGAEDRLITQASFLAVRDTPERKVETYVCDWYSENGDMDPVIIVATFKDGTPRPFDECPEVLAAFREKFEGSGIDNGPINFLSDYIYVVVTMTGDTSHLLETANSNHFLRVHVGSANV
ncbi:hypothetical protein ACTMTF_15215 [Nonomuraea sp. ZG12]|uniref:hypothetical protein n=1 Tax=Nonomuraea sp. ZG12 TaxID=3452207 RepID=UPI003F8B92D5